MRDPLTGLASRALLSDRIEQLLARSARQDSMIALLLIDIDDFQTVNERYGQRVGDEALRSVAHRLSRLLRADETLARYAGDAFVIGCADADEVAAERVAERVSSALSNPIDVDGHAIVVTVSIGIALASSGVADLDGLLRDAERAITRAQHSGGARSELFDEELREQRQRAERLSSDLAHATSRDELELLFQPFVLLGHEPQAPAHGDVVAGAEALLRWRHPHEHVAPDEFIPLADLTGTIFPMGAWILHEACRHLARWQQSGHADGEFTLFVNLSPRQLSDRLLVQALVRALDETGANPRGLGLEVSERALIEADEDAMATLELLMAMGVRLAVDDFGTGHATLEQIKRFPVDLIKVDTGYIANLEHTTSDRAVVSAVTALARELGVAVLAEGVETSEQLEAVRALRCNLAQGYHLGHPVHAEAIDALLGVSQGGLQRS